MRYRFTLETAMTPATIEELDAMPIADAIKALRRDFGAMEWSYHKKEGARFASHAEVALFCGNTGKARNLARFAFAHWVPAATATYRYTGRA